MKLASPPRQPFPLPNIVWAEARYEGATVTLEVDPYSKWGGAISKTNWIRAACPASILEDMITWILIQKERKRLGLPYLTAEEMGPLSVAAAAS